MRFHKLALAGAALLVAAACSTEQQAPVTRSLSPSRRAPGSAVYGRRMLAPPLAGETGTGDTVTVVERAMAIESDIARSAVIGPKGGSIAIPEIGATLIVPANAVSTNTNFTMTALAGVQVAFEFEPHGAVFAQPLRVEQTTTGLVFPAGEEPSAGYFTDRSDLVNDLVVGKFKEKRRGKHDKVAAKLTFEVDHFSGYALATGRSSITTR